MRMCYLSISHTNVFSVTVPPGRLQEGSGALIKAAFAGQECGLPRPGVTEGLGVRLQSLCSHGRPAKDWACRHLCLAVIRHFSLSLAFPLRPPAPPPLATAHSHVTTHTRTCIHTHLSLLSSFPSLVPWGMLGFPAACLWSALFRGSIQEITVITLLLPRSGPKLQGEEQN